METVDSRASCLLCGRTFKNNHGVGIHIGKVHARPKRRRVLILHVKGVYFDQMENGSKPFEFRMRTPYWKKRLEGRHYDAIEICRGYPPRGDRTRRMRRPWRGWHVETITHEHFGVDPVEVYAIRVNPGKMAADEKQAKKQEEQAA